MMGEQKVKFSLEEIKKKIAEIEPSVTLLSTCYINNKEPLLFRCSCGKEFQKTWDTINSRKFCKCRSCAHKNGWVKIRRSSQFEEESFSKFIAKGFTPLEPVKNSKSKILCIDNQGYKGKISLANVELDKHFGIFSLKFNKEYLLYNLNNYAKLCGINTQVVSFEEKNKSCETIIYCICECGEHFTTNIGNFTTQNKLRCEKCNRSISNLEIKVKIELEQLHINYISQKRFDDCRNPKTNYPLAFDFYLPDYHTCIEVDGSQHYKISSIFYRKEENALKIFNDNQFRDNIKTTYCKTKNIKLIRISYIDIGNDNYKQILKNLFS